MTDRLTKKRCPKCGGRSGYQTHEAQVFSRITPWDGGVSEAEYVRLQWKNRKPTCIDCGTSIRIPKEHKDNLT